MALSAAFHNSSLRGAFHQRVTFSQPQNGKPEALPVSNYFLFLPVRIELKWLSSVPVMAVSVG
jgi:hypothetical protein